MILALSLYFYVVHSGFDYLMSQLVSYQQDLEPIILDEFWFDGHYPP